MDLPPELRNAADVAASQIYNRDLAQSGKDPGEQRREMAAIIVGALELCFEPGPATPPEKAAVRRQIDPKTKAERGDKPPTTG